MAAVSRARFAEAAVAAVSRERFAEAAEAVSR